MFIAAKRLESLDGWCWYLAWR